MTKRDLKLNDFEGFNRLLFGELEPYWDRFYDADTILADNALHVQFLSYIVTVGGVQRRITVGRMTGIR